ncbi:twin-arginine translocase TatA/TatE family subunit [Candidatus Hydrogenedentota bacterium]
MLPGGAEWLIVLLIIMIIFGAGKLPSVLRSMGQGVREFKDASSSNADDSKDEKSKNEDEPAS